MRPARRSKGNGGITHPMRPRPCLVCQEQCMTEGQLCVPCGERGHRVTDTEVIVNIELEWKGP